jgi:hypothetical protein
MTEVSESQRRTIGCVMHEHKHDELKSGPVRAPWPAP